MNLFIVFCFLSLYLSTAFGDGVTILYPSEIEGHLISGPLALLPRDFDVEGIMVFAPTYCTFDELTDEDISKMNGKIVLFPSTLTPEKSIELFRRYLSAKVWRQGQRGNEMERHWSYYARLY